MSGKTEQVDQNNNLQHSLEDLVNDVRCLARYAVETDQLPASVEIEKLYKINQKFEQKKSIDDHEFATLVESYQVLERRLGPVSATTLKATGDRVDADGKPIPSEARHYVNYLFSRTVFIILLILGFHIIHHYFPSTESITEPLQNGTTAYQTQFLGLIAVFLIPFLYGALGADAYLLRETTEKLHNRQFDPRKIPENRARFLLGTLSGGVIVLFVSEDILNLPGTVFEVGGAALGFIAGFSTDFLFDTIERIIGALLPKIGPSRHTGTIAQGGYDDLLRYYRRLMDEADSPDKKKVLKIVIEDLEARSRHSIT